MLFLAWDYFIDPTKLAHTVAVRLPFSFFKVAVFDLTFLKSFELRGSTRFCWQLGQKFSPPRVRACALIAILIALPASFVAY